MRLWTHLRLLQHQTPHGDAHSHNKTNLYQSNDKTRPSGGIVSLFVYYGVVKRALCVVCFVMYLVVYINGLRRSLNFISSNNTPRESTRSTNFTQWLAPVSATIRVAVRCGRGHRVGLLYIYIGNLYLPSMQSSSPRWIFVAVYQCV